MLQKWEQQEIIINTNIALNALWNVDVSLSVFSVK
jgi:hypothetical protein